LYRIKIVYVFLISCFLSFFANTSYGAKTDNVIIATVNKENISQSELYYYINKYESSSDELKGEAGKRKILDKLIDFKLMLSVSKEYGEEKNPIVKASYEVYLLRSGADLFRTYILESIRVSQDEIDIAFVESDKTGKQKSKEQITSEKEKIRDRIFKDKYAALLLKELENLKKSNNIKVYDDIIDKLDKGEDVKADTPILKVNDENVTYERIESLLPQNVRHSPESRTKKKDFLSAFIEQVVELYLYANEAKRLGLDRSNIYYQFSITEYYEKLLVNMLDFNKEFTDKLYGDVQVTDEEVKEFYNEKRTELTDKAPFLRIKSLTFSNEEDARAAQKDLKSGTDYIEVKKKYLKSIKDDKLKVGNLPKEMISESYGKEFSDNIVMYASGYISDIIKKDDLYLLINLVEKEGLSIQPFEHVKDSIKTLLTKDKSKKAFEEYFREIKKSKDVTINEVLFDKMRIEQ